MNNGLFEMWREMGRKRIGEGIKGRRGEGQGWGGWEGDWVEEARVEEGRRKVGRK